MDDFNGVAERLEMNGEKGPITEEIQQECKEFIVDLVDRIFNKSSTIVQEDNAKFGIYSRTTEGRALFARLVDSQRVNTKRVSEQTFYRLVQFFALCLFECNEADDFHPAKCLMNMSYTFFHYSEEVEDRTQDVISPDSEEADDSTNGGNNNDLESPSNPKPPKVKSFLYTHLKEQPIWKCQRFWNASFFESVHHERTQHSPDGKREHWRHMSSEDQELAEIMEENITFGQLATFLHNMMGLGLSEQFTRRFLDKMGVIGNITKDQYDMLAANIASHFKASPHIPAAGKETRQWSLSNLGTPIRRRLSSLMKQPSKH